MPDILECEEFGELPIRLDALLEDGELRLDDRIASRGYLNATFSQGQVVLRATKFVGLIPLTKSLSIRVRPRAGIASLSHMLVRSGVIPDAVVGFARGYTPLFVPADHAQKVYGRSLVAGVKRIAQRGFMKRYVGQAYPPSWRGRLLASETVRLHAAKGIRYRHAFDYSILSSSILENIAIKAALVDVRNWAVANGGDKTVISEANGLIHALSPVADWAGPDAELIRCLGRTVHAIPSRHALYRDPMWTSLLILQQRLPETEREGFASLDSLIINVSTVFEGYVRRELAERMPAGFVVEDGNKASGRLFKDSGNFPIHPDIVVRRQGQPVLVLDAKYKLKPKEQDRYEVLSFMDALGVKQGGFVCPTIEGVVSHHVGTTASGKSLSTLRYNLAASDPVLEADRFAANVMKMIDGSVGFD